MIEALAACFIVIFIILSFMLGFLFGLRHTSAGATATTQRIAVNEEEDVLFDRLDALRRTRFAPPMQPSVPADVPRVPASLAAKLKSPIKNPRKDK